MKTVPEQLRQEGAVVRFEMRGDHTALVTLNRPEARNAISVAMAEALESIVDATEADPQIRAVVLCSAHPQVFCAGADLKEVHAGRGNSLFTERGGFAGLVFAKREKPWIAAVNGKALARVGDPVACGSTIASGSASVFADEA